MDTHHCRARDQVSERSEEGFILAYFLQFNWRTWDSFCEAYTRSKRSLWISIIRSIERIIVERGEVLVQACSLRSFLALRTVLRQKPGVSWTVGWHEVMFVIVHFRLRRYH